MALPKMRIREMPPRQACEGDAISRRCLRERYQLTITVNLVATIGATAFSRQPVNPDLATRSRQEDELQWNKKLH